MKPRQYFPLGKAYGKAFCNRKAEIKDLMGNIENGKHTFLAAPRRYGKSSLCEAAIEKLGLPSAKIDLHVATSEKGIERLLLKAILELIGEAVGPVDKVIQNIKYKLKNLKPKLSFEATGVRLELEIAQEASPPETIREAILFLDKLLQDKNQNAVLLIDEFQRVAEIAPNMGIEGGIRSAAQETKYLAFIFSGSNRHLIESIFQDEGRPLYRLCKKIRLERISSEHYKDHLNIAAKIMWKAPLPQDVFEKIMTLTERHPYYVNNLCDSLWSLYDKLPDQKAVDTAWQLVIEADRSDLLKEFYGIADNPKKLLIYLAIQYSNNHGTLYSTETAKHIGMPTTSVAKALQLLLSKDFIEEAGKGRYQVINPVYKFVLAE